MFLLMIMNKHHPVFSFFKSILFCGAFVYYLIFHVFRTIVFVTATSQKVFRNMTC